MAGSKHPGYRPPWTEMERFEVAKAVKRKHSAQKAGLLKADRVIQRDVAFTLQQDKLLGKNGHIATFNKLRTASASLLFDALAIAAKKLETPEKVTLSQATMLMEKAGSLMLKLDAAEQGRDALTRAVGGGDVAKRAGQLRDIATELLQRAEQPVDISPNPEDEDEDEDAF